MTTHNTLKNLRESLMSTASPLASSPPLSSGQTVLDDFLEGGLRWGELSEWGLPWAQTQRELIFRFLVSAQHSPSWILWVYGRQDISINPLAWQAHGLNLSRLRFVQAQRPVQELKPLFLSSLFRIIVLDGVQQLAEDDYGFLARQARRHQQVVMILHPHQLSLGSGNVWARMRINCWFDSEKQSICAEILKGRRPKQLIWNPQSL